MLTRRMKRPKSICFIEKIRPSATSRPAHADQASGTKPPPSKVHSAKDVVSWNLLEYLSIQRIQAQETQILQTQSDEDLLEVVFNASMLIQDGHSEEAVALFEQDTGITAEDYPDRSRLRDKLNPRLEDAFPDSIVFYLSTFAYLVATRRDRQAGRRLLEAHLGIEDPHYKDRDILEDRVQQFTVTLSIDGFSYYLSAFAGILGIAQKHAQALAIYEATLSLRPEFYLDPEPLKSRLDPVLTASEPDGAASFLYGLSGALAVIGRPTDALRVLMVGLDLTSDDLSDSDSLQQKVLHHLQRLTFDMAIVLATFLGSLLHEHHLGPEALRMIETFFGLQPDDYANSAQLRAKLNERFTETPVENSRESFMIFINLLLTAHQRSEDALALLEADTGLDVEDFGSPERLRERWDERLGSLYFDMAITYTRALASVLNDVGRAPHAVLWLEASFVLAPEHYLSSRDLAEQLNTRLPYLSQGTGASYIFELYHALRDADQATKARQLLAGYFDHRIDLEGDLSNIHELAPQLCPLFQHWLHEFGREADHDPITRCRQFVPYLRQSLVHQGVHLEDRREFVKYVGTLRQAILETGQFWAEGENDPERAELLWIDVQLWDAELSQRLLIEQFLLEKIQLVESEDLPTDGWSWHEAPPESDSILPDTQEDGVFRFLDEDLRFDPLPAATSYVDSTATHPRLLDEARRMIEEGVDTSRLAQSLGETGLLLRGTFSRQGELLWSAFQSDGDGLRFLDANRGRPTDLEDLRWATAWHDVRMLLARWSNAKDVRKRAAMNKAVDLVADWLDLLEQGETGIRARLGQAFDEQMAAWKRDFDALSNLAREGDGAKLIYRDAYRLLVLGIRPLLGTSSRDEEPWVRITMDRLEKLRALLEARRSPVANLQRAIDRITREYLQEIDPIWTLDALAPHLTDRTDLVAQIDDALHAVPLAFLNIEGQPLFRRVASLRSSLTLMMTLLQQQTERNDEQTPEEKRLLVLSHFKDTDRARTSGRWLHHGFRQIAQQHGMDCLSAAQSPQATVGLIRAATEAYGSFDVAALCGHGYFFRSGLAMADAALEHSNEALSSRGFDTLPDFSVHAPGNRLWNGGGCDLSGIDWLWLVSCSIGRLRQNGDRNVEGFSVELALHRARSVAAFRWPVHAIEAVTLTNATVEHYIRTRSASNNGLASTNRARALNAARQRFFGQPSVSGARVSLNTLAACELFGLG